MTNMSDVGVQTIFENNKCKDTFCYCDWPLLIYLYRIPHTCVNALQIPFSDIYYRLFFLANQNIMSSLKQNSLEPLFKIVERIY